jgi:hypothetical protein
MKCHRNAVCGSVAMLVGIVCAGLGAPALAQRDPAEPQQGRPHPTVFARPAGAVARKDVDEKAMRGLIEQLVACGTRLSLSSWSDAKRGIGCGRDRIAARLKEIARDSGGKLQVVVDKFDATSERTSGKALQLESVYAVLRGTDTKLAKTVFIVSGHFDSRPSNVMDVEVDAPGADDDASGVAVSLESARLLSRAGANGKGGYRATLLFAAISGEEQGLLGGYRLLEWAKQQGYTIGGMLDDDIVGDDPSPSAPHRGGFSPAMEKSTIAIRRGANWHARLKRSMGGKRFDWFFAWTVTAVAVITIRFTKWDCPQCVLRSRSKTTITSIKRRARRTESSTGTSQSI